MLKGGDSQFPPTVSDQIRLWENERNRFTFTEGVLYNQFLSQADYETLNSFADQQGSWNHEMHSYDNSSEYFILLREVRFTIKMSIRSPLKSTFQCVQSTKSLEIISMIFLLYVFSVFKLSIPTEFPSLYKYFLVKLGWKLCYILLEYPVVFPTYKYFTSYLFSGQFAIPGR